MFGINDEHDCNVISMNSLNIHDVNDMQSYKLGDAMFEYQLDYASHDSYFIQFAPTIPNEKKFAYVESNKNSMLVDPEKNVLSAGYMVEFIVMLLKIIMREEHMLVVIAIISSFLSMCLKF